MHQALYVCYDNPNPMVADYPTAYEGQPGFEFLQQVPTWWDETRVLVGQIGEVLQNCILRRLRQLEVRASVRCTADLRSAIQPIENLRYVVNCPGPPRNQADSTFAQKWCKLLV
jgi:hypothetical protein